jgi:hypothetical protein
MVKIIVLLCALSDGDRAWATSALEAWRITAAESLHLSAPGQPRIIFFDGQCTWPGDLSAGTPHDGQIALPDGEKMPARVASFAAWNEGQPFMVMALPSVWKADPRHAANKNVEQLTRSVFIHEMTHTQSGALGDRVGEIITKYQLPSNEIDDDIVQKKFGENAELRAAVEAERDLFYEGRLAEALERMRARRARFLSGENQRYAELEDVFLLMEGAANWAAVRDLMRHMPADEAIAAMRGSRRWWTQDEGLAIFLAIDAAVPDWQSQVFGKNPPTLEQLLERAAAAKGW